MRLLLTTAGAPASLGLQAMAMIPSEPSGIISFALWCLIWLTTTAVWVVLGIWAKWYDTYFLCWRCRRCSWYVSVRLLASSSERWLCELSSSTLLEVCRAYGIDGWPFVVGILEVIRCEAASDNCRRSEPSGFISFALWCQI